MHDSARCLFFVWALLANVGCGNGGYEPPGPLASPPMANANQTAIEEPAGEFLYDGEPPERQELMVDKDKEAFKLPLLDESLVVDPESKGISNVVMWLRALQDAPPMVHPSYGESLNKPQEVFVQNARFEPHITTVRVGQQILDKGRITVEIKPGDNDLGEFVIKPEKKLFP
jgi:hypothetical protein